MLLSLSLPYGILIFPVGTDTTSNVRSPTFTSRRQAPTSSASSSPPSLQSLAPEDGENYGGGHESRAAGRAGPVEAPPPREGAGALG